MGRHAGWVALYCGIASGADWILLPEVEYNPDEMIAALAAKRKRGKQFGLVVASEGVELPATDTEDVTVDAFGHVTLRERRVGEHIARDIERELGIETRSVVLGHVQRGGPPTVFDRVLGSRVGVLAGDLVKQGKWGMMAALHGTEVVPVPLEDAVSNLKTVPLEMYEMAKTLFSH
jgi:6-phosphofructokinase 1